MKKVSRFVLALLLVVGTVSLYSGDQFESCNQLAYEWLESGTSYEDTYEMFEICMQL